MVCRVRYSMCMQRKSNTKATREETLKALPLPPTWAATIGWGADYWINQENGNQLEACERDVEFVDDDPIQDHAMPGYDETDD
jgi:hypothetical protein